MIRMILYEAVQTMLMCSAKWSWLKAWTMKVARRREMKKAIVALSCGWPPHRCRNRRARSDDHSSVCGRSPGFVPMPIKPGAYWRY